MLYYPIPILVYLKPYDTDTGIAIRYRYRAHHYLFMSVQIDHNHNAATCVNGDRMVKLKANVYQMTGIGRNKEKMIYNYTINIEAVEDTKADKYVQKRGSDE